jgi:predicted phosphoribosyltransferase
MVQLPFRDRRDAGQQLGDSLAQLDFDFKEKTIILGLARGGVAVGAEVAALLHLPLDVVVVRKLGFPGQKELAIGAAAGGQIRVLNKELIEEYGIHSREVETIAGKAIEEASWRELYYRAERAAPDLHDWAVILVDDGLATGSSMLAAVRYVNSFQPKKVIAAAPVGTKEACSRLKNFTDACVCLATPKGFHAVGQCYLDFTQVTDEEVRQILEQNDVRAGLEQQGPLTGALP